MIVAEGQVLFSQATPCVLGKAGTYGRLTNVAPVPLISRYLHTSHPLHAIDVKVPSMGDSITEGSISTVLRQTGDLVEEDEPILQIETDKVRTKAVSMLNIMHFFGAPSQPKVCGVCSCAVGHASTISAHACSDAFLSLASARSGTIRQENSALLVVTGCEAHDPLQVQCYFCVGHH